MTRIRLLAMAVMVYFALEMASSAAWSRIIPPEQRQRLFELYGVRLVSAELLPHPFLQYVSPDYVAEEQRYVSLMREREADTSYIIAMGSSTTADGWPEEMERQLNEGLSGSGQRVRVFNFAVDGWSSLNSIQNYFRLLIHSPPDIIIIHHAIDDGSFDEGLLRQSPVVIPEVSPSLRFIIARSSLARLVVYGLHRLDAILSRGESILSGDATSFERISAALSDAGGEDFFADRGAVLATYEPTQSVESPQPGDLLLETWARLLETNYRDFLVDAKARDVTVILTTQHADLSQCPDSKRIDERCLTTRQRLDVANRLMIRLGQENSLPVVDLEGEMAEHEDMLKEDGIHWNSEGVRLEAALIGEVVLGRLLPNGIQGGGVP